MRSTPLVVALFVACASGCLETHEHPGSAQPSTCEIATTILDQALDEAQRDAPPCEGDDDCVVLHRSVRCEPTLQLGDCGLVTHREVAARYAAKGVNAQVCEAVAGAEFGCSVLPLCVAQGTPECRQGVCLGSRAETRASTLGSAATAQAR